LCVHERRATAADAAYRDVARGHRIPEVVARDAAVEREQPLAIEAPTHAAGRLALDVHEQPVGDTLREPRVDQRLSQLGALSRVGRGLGQLLGDAAGATALALVGA